MRTRAMRDPREIGHILDVGYIVDVACARLGKSSGSMSNYYAESSRQLWSDQFNEMLGEPDAAQQHVAARLHTGVRDALIQIESARSQREHPNYPDAFDLAVQARALSLRPPSAEQQKQVLALYERALAANPSYMPALLGARISDSTRRLPLADVCGHAARRVLVGESAGNRAQGNQARQRLHVLAEERRPVSGSRPAGHQFIQTGPDLGVQIPGSYSQLGQCLTQATPRRTSRYKGWRSKPIPAIHGCSGVTSV